MLKLVHAMAAEGLLEKGAYVRRDAEEAVGADRDVLAWLEGEGFTASDIAAVDDVAGRVASVDR